MKNFQVLREIKVTADGDIYLDDNDDIAVSIGGEALAEHIMVRIRTFFNEASNMPEVGSTLDSFMGRPNSPETGEEIRIAVIDALTRDNFMNESDFDLEIIPTSLDTITIYIDPDPEGITVFNKVINFDINLKNGEIN